MGMSQILVNMYYLCIDNGNRIDGTS